ncbi:hypothetical protein IE987_21705 [Klebsiella pneumoniae]|uniref:Uncharacterized protein n=1 Tax=Klebsiella pneumoniae TaxID=573 RepID=A0A927HMB0_KLEPN|nr:hypothetical protein [Klebsiella pneumoniae]
MISRSRTVRCCMESEGSPVAAVPDGPRHWRTVWHISKGCVMIHPFDIAVLEPG